MRRSIPARHITSIGTHGDAVPIAAGASAVSETTVAFQRAILHTVLAVLGFTTSEPSMHQQSAADEHRRFSPSNPPLLLHNGEGEVESVRYEATNVVRVS